MLTFCPHCAGDVALETHYLSADGFPCPSCRTILTHVFYLYCSFCAEYFSPLYKECPRTHATTPSPITPEIILASDAEAVRELYKAITSGRLTVTLPVPIQAQTTPGNNGKSNGNSKSAPVADKGAANGTGKAKQIRPRMIFGANAPTAVPVNIGGPRRDTTTRSEEETLAVEYEFIKDGIHLMKAIHELSTETLLAVDTETTGLDPHTCRLLLVQVGTPRKIYIIDNTRVDARPLKSLLENPNSLKILQNAKFDYKWLKLKLGIEVQNIFDTMLAERLLTAGVSREISLAQLVSHYLNVVLPKAERKSFIGMNTETNFSEDQLRYAARDVKVLFGIAAQQEELLKKEKLLIAARLEFDCIAAVGDMELAGCLIDVGKWRKIIDAEKIKRDEIAKELAEMLESTTQQSAFDGFGVSSLNLNSGNQLIVAFKTLGIDLPDTMEATLVKFNHPAVKKLLEYRTHEKTLSAFGEKFLELINKETGRIHPDFNQYGADTGRFSCSNPNVQQIPATSDFRACFIPRPGYKLITCDYSQAELRILAELSRDNGFIDAFNTGGDLHSLTASNMFQVPVEEVTKQMRNQAKAINFGLAYGMGADGLANRIEVTKEEAEALITTYFKAYSGVQKWLDKAAKEAVRRGYTETPVIGRKRFYEVPEQSDPEYRRKVASIQRQGKNMPIQGANADITKLALVGLKSVLKDYDCMVVNCVHDEIIVEAREDIADIVCEIVEREMIAAAQKIITAVPIVADATVGDYWKK